MSSTSPRPGRYLGAYAKETFNIDGKKQTLHATLGHASYGSGLNARMQSNESGTVSIDVNDATFLPCSFSLAWNFPIPPFENPLRVPIEAGERLTVERDDKPMR